MNYRVYEHTIGFPAHLDSAMEDLESLEAFSIHIKEVHLNEN